MKSKNLEMNSMIFLLTNALFFLNGIHAFSKISMKATILSMVIATFFSYIILTLFFHFTKGKTLSFKKVPKIIAGIIIALSMIILNYSLTRIIGFVTYNVVSSISYYLFITAFLLVCLFAVYKGFHAIKRSAFIYFLTVLFLTIITVIALFPKMNFQNVLPIFDTELTNIFRSMGLYICICLSPYFYLSFFDVSLTNRTIRSFKRSFILTQIFLISYLLITFSILGISITNLYPYPEVSIFKKVSFLNIIDRMESIFSLSYFLSLFTHFTITLYGVVELLQKFVKKEKRALTLFITCFLLFLINDFYKVEIFSLTFCSVLLLMLLGFTLKSSTQK